MNRPVAILLFAILSAAVSAQVQGSVVDNTNLALPDSYNYKEYQYAEPDDQGTCTGATNSTAELSGFFISQTHRHEISHPFFFIIGHRPALLQLAIEGTGAAPDVSVEGFRGGNSIGALCLKGPATLRTSLNTKIPSFEDYFTVTLPKDWVRQDLTLTVKVGEQEINFSEEELKVGPYTELNLVEVKMDFMDFNIDPHRTPIFETFLEELASAIPVSTVRYGVFPETLKYPEIVANNDTEQLARLRSRSEMPLNNVFSDGYINSIAALALSNLQHASGDFLSTVYFGNTLNLAPGGWGGGNSFVGFDFTDIFIHELGHALSLPHWGEGPYANTEASEYEYNYPYGGEESNGGGRGENWNFNQHAYEFVDPLCRNEAQAPDGTERSDCMQRSNACLEGRNEGYGPWDGFGDFSAYAMHTYMIGDENVRTGTVQYKGADVPYQFRMQKGFPVLSLEDGRRTYTRTQGHSQDQLHMEEVVDFPGDEELNAPAYLVYGSLHETQEQANIMYKPIKFNGTIPHILDPTDPATFEKMKEESFARLGERDITIKVTYTDGSVLHALDPWHSFARAPYEWGFHIWRDDVVNFSLVVPGDKELEKVEAYIRPFVSFSTGNEHPGNINDPGQNITADNFMDEAIWKSEYSIGQAKSPGLSSIGNRVWHDVNQNGVDDDGEPGIEGVKLLLWEDSDDDDDIPDSQGFIGIRETDEEGRYSFTGLLPGKYVVFVWHVDNYDLGGPLNGMIPVASMLDPNTDIDKDDNGFPAGFPGLGELDIASGIIELSAANEPLGDGDREDDWFDYDVSGNQTIDFGFFFENSCIQSTVTVEIAEILCPGDLASISLSPTDPNEVLTYEWEDGSNDSTLTNIMAGTYSVSFTNEELCLATRVIEIVAPIPLEIIVDAPDSLCAGETASVDIEITGGLAPYSVSTNAGSEDFGPGTYSITAIDENNCELTQDFTIEEAGTTACTSGIGQEGNIDLKITPNPFLERITIGNQAGDAFHIQLYSITGGMIMEQNIAARSTVSVDVSALLSGIYIARVSDGQGGFLHSYKLVKL